MQANANAELIVGFNKKVTKKQYVEYLSDKKITKILNLDKVKKGDVYFLETGTVHAIGAGILLAEIQQTSNITYRIYDWDRKDNQGNKRELHTKQALDAIDFKVKESYKTEYKSKKNQSNKIVKCPYFTTNVLLVDKELTVNYKDIDSFVIYMCVLGEVKLHYSKNKSLTLQIGETILIPNCLNELKITSKIESELLEVFIE
jgi:mannose-6-phosphate isomerase